MKEYIFQFIGHLVSWQNASALIYMFHDILPRSKMHEIQVQKPPEVVEMAPRRNLGSLDNDSSSSVRICFLLYKQMTDDLPLLVF